MAEMRHDEGPWRVDMDAIGSDYPYMVFDAKGGCVVDVINGPNAKANARLIAAAPELLAACREVMVRLSTFSDEAAILRTAIHRAEAE